MSPRRPGRRWPTCKWCSPPQGGRLEDLVKTTIIMQQDIDLNAAFGVWMEVWGRRPNPPTVTGFRVAGLANPDFLIEIEAQAVLK